eukprot:gnl/TRDRNA2_/TRDRNA2_168111_c1_seq3.p2 gnl/TRDRNA2_/TRDRNA2_168111_c1~~gnl/TRDRNA2_/TRDRNA2_168111_c1_seq3.p2  ORF type:complete len:221 (-),score=39.07 gnl/TRDRNA2_/TRDRNA2_168111_c1_seq3:280-942(-)
MSLICILLAIAAPVVVDAGSHEDACMAGVMEMEAEGGLMGTDGKECFPDRRRLFAETAALEWRRLGSHEDQGTNMMAKICMDSKCKEGVEKMITLCEGHAQVGPSVEMMKPLVAMCNDPCGSAYVEVMANACGDAVLKPCESSDTCKAIFCKMKSSCSCDTPPSDMIPANEWKQGCDMFMTAAAADDCLTCAASEEGATSSAVMLKITATVSLFAVLPFM